MTQRGGNFDSNNRIRFLKLPKKKIINFTSDVVGYLIKFDAFNFTKFKRVSKNLS